MIAQFRNWEQLLYLTQPDQWSAAAMYQVSLGGGGGGFRIILILFQDLKKLVTDPDPGKKRFSTYQENIKNLIKSLIFHVLCVYNT